MKPPRLFQWNPRLQSPKWSSDSKDSVAARANFARREFLISRQNCSYKDYEPFSEFTLQAGSPLPPEQIANFDKRFGRSFRYRIERHGLKTRILLCKEIDRSNRVHWHCTTISRLSFRDLDELLDEVLEASRKGLDISLPHHERIEFKECWLRYCHKVRKTRESLLAYSRRVYLFKRGVKFPIVTSIGKFYRDKKPTLYDQAMRPCLN